MATRIAGGATRPSFSADLHCHCSRSLGSDYDSGRRDHGNGIPSLQSGRVSHVRIVPSAFCVGELNLSGGSSFWEELGFGRRSRNRRCGQSRPFSAFLSLQPSSSAPDTGPVVPWFRNGSAGGDPDNRMKHNKVDNQKRKERRSHISKISSSGIPSSRRRVRCQVTANDAAPEHLAETETNHANGLISPQLGHRTFRRRKVICRVAAKEAPPNLSRQSIPPVKEEVPARCEKAPELPKYSAPAFPRRLPSQLQYEEGVLGGISAYTRGVGRLDLGADTLTYLKKILTSRVYDVAVESPLERANKVSDRVGSDIFLKREDLQKVFSFKLRGAYNMMAQLPPDALERGVICSSAGNHAQGVALAAAELGCSAIICMPVTTPAIKWNSVKRLGATVVLVGEAYDETQAYAKQRALEEGRVFVPPFDHPDVIAGQGTVGMEILRQHPGPIHAIFVPVGGGGLIAGIAAYVKCLRPEVKIIGVEPADANAMALSLHEGQRICLDKVGGFADGVAVKMVGEETFRICRELIDGVVLVSKDAICAAIKDVFEETRCILEPAGALALAGAKAYCKYNDAQKGGSANGVMRGAPGSMVVITSGANMNFDRLRVVAELAEVGERREAVLATSIPERPGTFKEFCRLVGSDINISEFKYRRADNASAHVFYSVNVGTDEELANLLERMAGADFPTIDMSGNDLAKTHLRHLVGGRNSVEDEVLYRFEFPERPGALLRFLDFISPRWDITLFHYRAEGERVGNVLVGLQIPPAEEAQFRSAADALGYQYVSEGNNEAFRMFLR